MRHPRWVVTAVLLVTVALGAGMGVLRFDNSYEIWFVEGDPALASYDEFVELFGSDESLIVLVEAEEDPLAEGDLRVTEALSAAIAQLEGVDDVWSLTHMEAMVDTGGALEVRRLVEEIPLTEAQAARVRALVATSPLYRSLMGGDGRTSSIVAHLDPTEGSFDPKARLVRAVSALAATHAQGRRHWVTGGAAFDEAIYRHSESDSLTYAPLMGLVIACVLGWLFGSVAAVVLAFLVVIAANVWALGFMGWVGWDANILTTILPPILAAVAIADSVHLLQHVRVEARRGADREAAVRSAFLHVLRPCLITSLTTAAGMLSLMAAHLQAIREFGVSVAVGVVAAFVTTLFILPVLLRVVPQAWMGGLLGEGVRPAPRWLGLWADFALRRRRAVCATALVVVALAGWGMARLTVGASMVSYLYEDDPTYVAAIAVDRALGGSFPYEVLIRARPGDDLLDPEDLAAIEAIAAYLDAIPFTGTPFSGVDFVKEARRVLLGQAPGRLDLPATRAEAAQLLLLLEGEGDIGRFLSDDHRHARIEVPIEAGSYEKITQRGARIEADLRRLAGGRFDVEVTGLSRLMGAMEEYLVDSQIRSFGLAFLLVIGFIALFFRSWRAGLLSAIPNLLPLALTVGLMGWTGIRLDLTTVLLAPLLLGIVVDDTVHLMERVLGAVALGATVEESFREAVVDVGYALLMTSLILAAGFMMPLLGSFRPNRAFGLLSILSIALALVADLMVFPAVAASCPAWVVGGAANWSRRNGAGYAPGDAP